MNLFMRFRLWCAQKLIDEERLRCAGLVVQHGEECREILARQTRQIWLQGYAQGQKDLLEPYLAGRNGKELVN